MLKSTVLFLLLILSLRCAAVSLDHNNRVLADSVAYLIENLPEEEEIRDRTITDLKHRYLTLMGRRKIESANALGYRYVESNLDSAAHYYMLAYIEAKRRDQRDQMQLFTYKYQALRPAMGIVKETLEWFESLDPNSVDKELRRHHWLAGSQIYYTAQMYYPDGPQKRMLLRKTLTAIDSLRRYYLPSSAIVQYLDALSYQLSGDSNLATANFINALSGLGDNPELRDNAMKHIADFYKGKSEYYQAYIQFLLQRVINTLNRGLVRPEALAALGTELKSAGYPALADKCFNLALVNEDLSYLRLNNRFRRNDLWISQFNAQKAHVRHLSYVVLALVALLIAALLLIFRFCRRIKRNGADRRKAQALAAIKEREATQVNNNLIELMFLAGDQLKEYNLFVLRKLKAGQSKDLFEEVESGKFQGRQFDKFLRTFDSEFLKIFPEFVAQLNSLLRSDRQLHMQSPDRFTPELRIAALIRLGISDSARIAGILRLSLNTIYTYRNRLRGRAKDRDLFDAQLMNIEVV